MRTCSSDVVLSDKSTRLQCDVVLDWFGGPQAFMDLQQLPVVLADQFTLEDDIVFSDD